MRRLQLRQWLVLLLRTLIIVLIVCAFARPTYQAGGGWGSGDRPVAVHRALGTCRTAPATNGPLAPCPTNSSANSATCWPFCPRAIKWQCSPLPNGLTPLLRATTTT